MGQPDLQKSVHSWRGKQVPGAGWRLFGCLGSWETGQEFSQGSASCRDCWDHLGPPHLHFSSLDVGRRNHVPGEKWTYKYLINFSAYSWHRQLLPKWERSCSTLRSFISSFCWGYLRTFPCQSHLYLSYHEFHSWLNGSWSWSKTIFTTLNRDCIKQQGHRGSTFHGPDSEKWISLRSVCNHLAGLGRRLMCLSLSSLVQLTSWLTEAAAVPNHPWGNLWLCSLSVLP